MLVFEGEVTIRYKINVSVDGNDIQAGTKCAHNVLSRVHHHITEEIGTFRCLDGDAGVVDGRTTDCRLMKVRR